MDDKTKEYYLPEDMRLSEHWINIRCDELAETAHDNVCTCDVGLKTNCSIIVGDKLACRPPKEIYHEKQWQQIVAVRHRA